MLNQRCQRANLLEWNISNGLPPEIITNKYDSIISTYTLHHLADEEKISFITGLLDLLKEEGNIFIGDISFKQGKNLKNVVRTILIIGMTMNFILYPMKLSLYWRMSVNVSSILFLTVVEYL